SAAYQFYCHKDLENAHTAMADTRATYEVLLAQIERYPDLDNNVPFLSEYSCRSRNVDVMGRIVYDDDNDEIVNFGKFKGRKIKELVRTEPRFFDWVQQADFAINTKQTFMRLFLKYKR
ncbi:MAG: 3'-5' exonuclease, partial [Bacteroidaceae bacterium]|nr:3'-5' exonuclease [Bacteroidaceae bacterium]